MYYITTLFAFFTFFLGFMATATPLPLPRAVDSETQSGIATYFYQNGNAGACGEVHSDWAHIVALQTVKYDNGKNCGKTIELTDTRTGKSATAVVADECPTCETADSIDLSEGLFEMFSDLSAGIFPVTWKFLN